MTDKKKEDELLNHDYDGIQEYDNDLPNWWKQLFILTIVFALTYTIYYHLGPGLSQEETLALEIKQAEKIAKWKADEEKLNAPKDINAELMQLVSNKSALEKGKVVFEGQCAACHGAQGQGIIGPNLTDNHWIHGGTIKEIHSTIENGVVEKGMIAWKALLSKDQLQSVVAYVWNLNGTNPTNPKKEEGVLVNR